MSQELADPIRGPASGAKSGAASSRRPSPAARCFTSLSLEAEMEEIASRIADPGLAGLFINCLPNTLDTTVDFQRDSEGRPDTFVITGDIDAMWLRDSAAQVWPYLQLAATDELLRDLIAGVIRRQARSILLDPYANAFYRDPVLGYWQTDCTRMLPGVHERKWELDSLAYFLRLSHGYWRATGDLSPFDRTWNDAVDALLALLLVEQSSGEETGISPYRFGRPGGSVLPRDGYGARALHCGLVRCAFRPSDDMVGLPYLVPANAMMSVALVDIASLLESTGQEVLASLAARIAREIRLALEENAVVRHPLHGEIWAYETDGYGNHLLMDDANAPSLLSLPYMGFCASDDPRYLRTRAFCLSRENSSFVSGRHGSGIGSPHTGPGTIWPMALAMQALTACDDGEILSCLRLLNSTHAETGFMHESFRADDPGVFTRPWFAWANTLFGELIMDLSHERPHLLAGPLNRPVEN